MAAPIEKFRARPLELAVWENEGKDGEKYYTFTLNRSYKTDDGEWKNTTSLRAFDLPVAASLLSRAHIQFGISKSSSTTVG